MSKYSYAKQTVTDWDEQIARYLKTQIKSYCLRSVLRKADRALVFAWINREIAEFAAEFDDSDNEQAIKDKYVDELVKFSEEVYDSVLRMVGGRTPYMFAQTLVNPEVLNRSQKDELGRYEVIRLNKVISANVLADIKDDDLDEGAYRRGTAGDTYYNDIHKAVVKEMAELTSKSQSDENKYLGNVNIRNIAEMGVRYDEYLKTKKQLISEGVRLVYVPPHSNCSKRCQPYQGKVYSLTGQPEKYDRGMAQPIENVADKVTVKGKRDPSRVYAAGLFAYNCRHTMTPYHEGQNLEVIPDSVIENQRAIEVKQRAMEREIRALREQHMLYKVILDESKNKGLKAETTAIWKKYLAKREEYRTFCRKNDVPRYDDRLKVIAGEDIYKRTVGRTDDRVVNKKISPK